jgi:hypothetical protein
VSSVELIAVRMGGERGEAKSFGGEKSLVLYKSLNTLWLDWALGMSVIYR